jgi:hypothetical protein
MASLNGQYDPDAAVAGDFEVFEAGVYPMEMIESDIVATKAGTGKLLKYRLSITQGELIGRLVFGQFNLTNPSADATRIGQGEFKALREVVGVLEPEDTADLHFKEFQGVVKITPAKGEYKAKNEINWGATYKLFADGTQPVAANDNEPPAKVAAPAAKAAPAATKPVAKAAWPRAKAA